MDNSVQNIIYPTELSIFAKSKQDASWGKFRQFIAYKAESAGKLFVPVPYRGTTQRCSQCGKTVYKELWDREHNCPCGFIAPRDYNSALEIRNLTLKKIEIVLENQRFSAPRDIVSIGQELPESTPVESKALPPLAATFVADTGNPTL
ncbi:MAG: transposase [Nanoarchaeota archaeon]|nr:transposase [Nanoarchaeota archaeon]